MYIFHFGKYPKKFITHALKVNDKTGIKLQKITNSQSSLEKEKKLVVSQFQTSDYIAKL